jgi:hypothetical protein
MDLGEVLSRAWQITWKHKVLWIFGILAGCSANGGSSGNNFQYRQEAQNMPPEVQRIIDRIIGNPAIIAGIIVLICILATLLLVLSTIGQIGLIKGVQKADQGAESLSFGEIWNASMSYFWRVFGLFVIIALLSFIVGIFLVALVAVGGVLTMGIGLICLLPLVCLLIPVGWALSVVVEQAIVSIVLENRSIIDGLSRGWEVVRANAVQYLLVALIVFIGGAIAGIVIAIPIFLIVFPAVFSMTISNNNDTTPLTIAMLCFVIYLPFLLVLSGILQTYIQSVWTLTFLRLTGHDPAVPVPQVEVVHE